MFRGIWLVRKLVAMILQLLLRFELLEFGILSYLVGSEIGFHDFATSFKI